MRIGVDLDGVMFDFQRRWAGLYETWFDVSMPPAKTRTWESMVSATHFADEGEFFSWFDHAEGWDGMDYIPGAPGAVDTMIRHGMSVVFITARHTELSHTMTRWWHRSSPWGKTTELAVGVRTKSTIPCSVYIDDSPAVIEQLASAGKRVVVFGQPWNKHLEGEHPRFVKWGEVLEHIGLEGPR